MISTPPHGFQILQAALRQMKREIINDAAGELRRALAGSFTASGQISAGALGGTVPSTSLPANVARVYTDLIGDGVATTITVTHGLASSALVVQCYLVASPFTLQSPTSIAIPNTTTVTIVFGVAPATDAIRVTVVGV